MVDQFPANDFVVHDGLLLTIQNEPEPVESVDRDAIQLAQEEKLKQREENNVSGSFPITDRCDGRAGGSDEHADFLPYYNCAFS